MIGLVVGVAFGAVVVAAGILLRIRDRRAVKLPPIRLWRRLPQGRQAVHRYVAKLEDLQGIKPHLGMRIYVRTLDRVYQWGIGRREEIDGDACVLFPEGPTP